MGKTLISTYSFLLIIICLKNSDAKYNFGHQVIMATGSFRTWTPMDLIDEDNKASLIRKFNNVPLVVKEQAFATLFSQENWFWTYLGYTKDVRTVWLEQMSDYMKKVDDRSEWKLHCIDAQALCQNDEMCSQLHNEFIDTCHLNKARMFGEANGPESLAFEMKQAKLKMLRQGIKRMRLRSCKNRYRYNIRRRQREPIAKLINRSAPDRPQIIDRKLDVPLPQLKDTSLIRKMMVREKYMNRRQKMPSYDEVIEKIRYWAGKKHKNVYAKWCENLDETCPVDCYDSLKKFNSTIYAPLLNKCDLHFSNLPRNLSQRIHILGFSRRSNLWDEKIWRVQRRRVNSCRPKVYRTMANQRPGCTLVMTVCRKSTVCYETYRDALHKCASAIEGRKCQLGCTVAMAELYQHAPSFFRCKPDGMKRPQWVKWHKNMGRSCNLRCAARSNGRKDAVVKC